MSANTTDQLLTNQLVARVAALESQMQQFRTLQISGANAVVPSGTFNTVRTSALALTTSFQDGISIGPITIGFDFTMFAFASLVFNAATAADDLRFRWKTGAGLFDFGLNDKQIDAPSTGLNLATLTGLYTGTAGTYTITVEATNSTANRGELFGQAVGSERGTRLDLFYFAA